MKNEQVFRHCFEESVIYFEAIWHRPITPMEADQLQLLVQQRTIGAEPIDIRRIAAGCAADLDYLDELGQDFFLTQNMDRDRLDAMSA